MSSTADAAEASSDATLYNSLNEEATGEELDVIPEKELQESLFEEIEDQTGGAMKPFLEEFGKMQQALRKSHESERRFVNKCQDLVSNIEQVKEKDLAYDAVMESNKRSTESLQRKIESADQKKIELENEMEERKLATISLRGKIAQLNSKMESWVQVLYQEQEMAIGALERDLDELVEKRDEERKKLVKLREANASLFSNVEVLETEKAKGLAEIEELDLRINEITTAVSKQMQTKSELDRRIEELKQLCEQRSLEIHRKVERSKKGAQELNADKYQLKDAMKSATASNAKLANLNEEAQELEDKFQERQDNTEEVMGAIESLQKLVDKDEAVINSCLLETKKKKLMFKKLRNRVAMAQEELGNMEAKKRTWLSTLETRRLECRNAEAAAAISARALDVASREREVLSHDYVSKLDSTAAHKTALIVAENASRNMENEIRAFTTAVQAWKLLIEQLVQDTDSYEDELQRKQKRTTKWLEKSAAKDVAVLALQKEIVEQETRQRQQQNLLESVRSDRSMYSKTLMEQTQEMTEFTRVFDSLNHSIVHLQQELNDKESAFVNEHLRVEHVDEEISLIEQRHRVIVSKYENVAERLREQTAQHESKEGGQTKKLNGIITEADEELAAQTMQYNAIVNEDRVLSLQLVKRNDEIATLYEKLRLQHSMMKKGDAHYSDKRKELMLLLEKKNDLMQELDTINFDREEIERYRTAIADMDKMLMREKLRARALDDELKKPMNVHRWRNMQDTNAETFTMIRQVRDLQKGIISKSSKMKEKDNKIEQKERLYVDLRRILARQPGQEVHEQLRIYEAAMKEKKSKHRAMRAELKMYQAKVHETKYQIEKLYKALELTKVAYFQRRRNEAREVVPTQQEENIAALKDMYLYEDHEPSQDKEERANSLSDKIADEGVGIEKGEMNEQLQVVEHL